MTHCSEFQNRWSDWHAGNLDNADSQMLWQHAQSCPRCAAYHRQMQSMLKALNSLPAPGAVPDDLTERLLHTARTDRPQRAYSTPQRLSVAAAVLVLVLGTALLNPFRPLLEDGAAPDARPVVVSLERSRPVHLVFESEGRVEDVEYTIELPDGVEVEGYPGLEVLRWSGELQAGRNGLTLPLIGRRAGAGGVLKARIHYQDAQRELTVPVQTGGEHNRDDKSAGAIHRPDLTTVSANHGSGRISI